METLKIGKSPTGPISKFHSLPGGRGGGGNRAAPVQGILNLHENKDIFKKLRHIVFLNLFQFNKKPLLKEQGGGTKKSHIFGIFHKKYFPHFTVLSCIKLIRKFFISNVKWSARFGGSKYMYQSTI